MLKKIEAEQFYKYGKRVVAKAGEIIYDAESYRTTQYAYFLDKGVCALSRMTRSGEERIYLYFKEKKTISFTQLLQPAEKGTNNFRITAKTESVLYKIPKENFMDLLENDKEFRTLIMDVLARNYVELLQRYHETQEMTIPQRIAELMLDYKQMEHDKWYLPDFFSYGEMAIYLGTHVVTVSRIMAKMKKDGYIEKEGHRIVVKDIEKLRQLVEAKDPMAY